jgi:hypothetical protein
VNQLFEFPICFFFFVELYEEFRISLLTFVYNFRAVSVFGDLKQQYGAGNCHLLQINSKRAGQTSGETDETTNMPDPWRLYVKQSSSSTQQQQQSQTMPKKDSSISDSLSNLTDLIDQELNLNSMSSRFTFKSDRK